MDEPSNFMPLPDPVRTSKYIRPPADFIPKDDLREYVYALFLLHMNSLPDKTINEIKDILRRDLGIRPILTRHLSYRED